jgi:hypothetical protein
VNRISFATLVFRGKRFRRSRVLLEAPSELAAYRVPVLEVSEGLFCWAHPRR